MSTPVKKVPIHLQSAANRLLVKNGRIVNATGLSEADIYIEEGIIKQLGRNLIIPGGTRVIDARGKLIIPGGIDPHTHLQFEFMGATSPDDFYQGTKAAIAGGTTTIIDFAIPRKDESLLDAYARYRENADQKVCCDYGLHVAVTSWTDKTKDEMRTLCEKHGVNSFKMFMAHSFMLRDCELYNAFEACREFGAVPMVHAENGDIIQENTRRLLASGITGPHGHALSRDEDVEAEAVNRACVIAKQAKTPLYIVHIMSPKAGNALVAARNNCSERTPLFGETLAAGLGTDGSNYRHECWSHAAGHVLSPPLRFDPTTPAALMTLLSQDDLQLTGSDNCTFTEEQKALGKDDFSKIPNGINGIEDRMSVVWEKGVVPGIIDPARFVAITSTNAAKIFNLYPQKGCIAVGSDADIVIWDPTKTRTISAKTHHHAINFNIFEGMQCHGVAEYVIINGRVCVDEGELKAVQGFGKYLSCNTFPPFVYGGSEIEPGQNYIDNNLSVQVQAMDALSIKNGSPASGISPVLREEKEYLPTLPNSAVSTPSCKGPRLEGQRNLQDSTFSISEDVDGEDRRSCIRVKNPPGGKSSGGFW